MDSLEIVTDVEINESVIISCPEIGFKPRRVCKSCVSCGYYNGLGRMSYDGGWHEQYVVRCSHIIERRTQLLIIQEN